MNVQRMNFKQANNNHKLISRMFPDLIIGGSFVLLFNNELKRDTIGDLDYTYVKGGSFPLDKCKKVMDGSYIGQEYDTYEFKAFSPYGQFKVNVFAFEEYPKENVLNHPEIGRYVRSEIVKMYKETYYRDKDKDDLDIPF